MEPSAMNALLQSQKVFFQSGETRGIPFRIIALKKLKAVISDHEKEILAAVYEDLRKEATDAYATEISGVYTEIKLAIENVSDWAARKKVPTPFFMRPSKSYIYKEPYGVGPSGLGRYHGKYSFDTFSHAKSILRSYNRTDIVEIAKPYRGRMMRLILKWIK